MSTSYDDIYAFIKQQQAVATELQLQLNSFYGEHPKLPPDLVIDENQSVKWNRDEVQRRNQSLNGYVGSMRAKINRCKYFF